MTPRAWAASRAAAIAIARRATRPGAGGSACRESSAASVAPRTRSIAR
jgi:hypothetical protein